MTTVRRQAIPALILGCLAAMVFACYGDALVRDRQFGYRDAAHFYYPLYQKVQEEWEAGRWPLWETEENSGMPLLGNPTAAVLYPGKVIYAAAPSYAWGARLYIVAHSLLAFAGMLLLSRSWGTSLAGAAIAAMGYAFGMPILFQYCNIIFLVGAAWLPFGFRAADRWLRCGRRWGLVELACVLAMQTLGGDPESAYVLGVCAGGYALGLSGLRGRDESSRSQSGSRPGRWRLAAAIVLLLVAWVGANVLLAGSLPAYRPPRQPGRPALALPWMRWVPWGVASAWGAAGLFLLSRWRRRGWRSPFLTMLSGLAFSAALAAGLAAVQLLPVLEFTGQSGRAAGGGPHDLFPFSLEPLRLVEFLWPNVFGTHFHGNRAWLGVIPPARIHAEVWVPSLYVGGLTVLLASVALGFRGGPPWRGWLSAILVVSLVASLGEFTGPLYWARWLPGAAAYLGPHDPRDTTNIRLDGFLRDGDGSFYWFLANALPGFRQFRYPSKLLTFTALALASLAGIGWDRVVRGSASASASESGRGRRPSWIAAGLLSLSLFALIVAIVGRDAFIGYLEGVKASGYRSGFGPFDPVGAHRELCSSLVQASVVMAIGLALVRWGRRAEGVAGALALLVMTVDLALANARSVLTVPQKLFETEPRVVRLIKEAEDLKPSPGQHYRVHRMPIWEPISWASETSHDRIGDFLAWERETIQPKYGLPYGVEYTLSLGVAELYDYDWFFGGFLRKVDDEAARALGTSPGKSVVVYPRRSFDLWNTRYFVLPAHPNDWADERRGYASFLPDTELVYPPPGAFEGPGGLDRQKDWIEHQDFQILRNLAAYPRAWVVHRARSMKPISGLDRSDRDAPMEELLYANDFLWHNPDLVVYDPHVLAWIDADKRAELLDYLPETRPGDTETATVTSYEPQRVVVDATLDQPGLVILAEVYYPGWHLTIDGKDAPIYRANRLMRGAAVPAGRHRLIYTYAPQSFAIGGRITIVASGLLVVLGVVFTLRPVTSSLSAEVDPAPRAPRRIATSSQG